MRLYAVPAQHVLAWLACLMAAVQCAPAESPEPDNQAGLGVWNLAAGMLEGDASFIEQFCVNYGFLSQIDNMYFTARNANPLLADIFGAGLGQMLDSSIGSIGPLGRVYLDRSCSPYTRQYNDSLAAYLRESSLANTTIAQVMRPWAGFLDAYYSAAQRDLARTESAFGPELLPPRFAGSTEADGNGGGLPFISARSGNGGGNGSNQLESALGNAFSTALNGFGTGAQGNGSPSQGGRAGGGGTEGGASLSEAAMGALESMSQLTLSGEDLQQVQARAAESPIVVGFVGILGDVNAAMLSLLESMRTSGGERR